MSEVTQPENQPPVDDDTSPERMEEPPKGTFTLSAIIAGVLALLFGFGAWGNDCVAGFLICFGALAKVISTVIGAASKSRDLESMKSWIEERLGYFDAAAALTAFPALFGAGAKLFFES